jgi:predicted O-linked N-acetylglucosamine transferase (SPINDLY family)
LLTRAGADQALQAFKLGPIVQAGLDPRRVVFHPGIPDQAAFLAYYQQLDIMLNSFPADAGTTICESLWMGVPVLVLDRPEALRHTGRALLTYVGMAEWVAPDLAGWIALARHWSGNLAALAALRAGLRNRFAASPLCDAAGSMRAIESAYRAMWREWCRG